MLIYGVVKHIPVIGNMKHLLEFRIFESVDKKFIDDFLQDLCWLMSMNLAMVKQQAKDELAKHELEKMQQTFSKPLINGKNIFELSRDTKIIYINPKLTSALISQSRELLLYIEPRIKKFVKDGEKKDFWLNKISDLKERYKKIIS